MFYKNKALIGLILKRIMVDLGIFYFVEAFMNLPNNSFLSQYQQLILDAIDQMLQPISNGAPLKEQVNNFTSHQFSQLWEEVDFSSILELPVREHPKAVFETYRLFEEDQKESLLDFQQFLYESGIKNNSRGKEFNATLKKCLSSAFYYHWWNQVKPSYPLSPHAMDIQRLLVPYGPNSAYLFYLQHLYSCQSFLHPSPQEYKANEEELWEFAVKHLNSVDASTILYSPYPQENMDGMEFERQGERYFADVLFIFQHHIAKHYLSTADKGLIEDLRNQGTLYLSSLPEGIHSILRDISKKLPKLHPLPLSSDILHETYNQNASLLRRREQK